MENNKISILLSELYDELKNVSSPLVHLFNDGLSLETIKQKFSGLPIELPDEVCTLFMWKNGINAEESSLKTIGQLELFSLGLFSSLDALIAQYEYYAISNTFWEKKMFPIFERGGGDFYLFDTDPQSETYRMIWYFSHTEVEFNGLVTTYDSLETLLLSVIECYRQKVYYYLATKQDDFADGPYLEIDFNLEAQIAKKYNPKSEYWKRFD